MFKFLKNTTKSDDDLKVNNLSKENKNALIATILLECAMEDGHLDQSETEHIKILFSKKMQLNDSEVSDLFNNAINESKKRTELYSLTKEIRDIFSYEEILEIFVYMWEIILIDGKIDDFESGLIRKAVGLFHITGKESSEAKAKATENIKHHKS